MMTITTVIFDLDGTITRPFLDFDAIRAEMGLSADAGITATHRATARNHAPTPIGRYFVLVICMSAFSRVSRKFVTQIHVLQ